MTRSGYIQKTIATSASADAAVSNLATIFQALKDALQIDLQPKSMPLAG
jgi:hypothetical protein